MPGFMENVLRNVENGGIYEADQEIAIPTATSFRTWCEDVLRPAVLG